MTARADLAGRATQLMGDAVHALGFHPASLDGVSVEQDRGDPEAVVLRVRVPLKLLATLDRVAPVEGSVHEDVARVREAVAGRLVPGIVDAIAVFPWHGVSLRLWSGGDPATCGAECINGHTCGKTSRYYGLHTRAAVAGFLDDLPREGLLTALGRWSG